MPMRARSGGRGLTHFGVELSLRYQGIQKPTQLEGPPNNGEPVKSRTLQAPGATCVRTPYARRPEISSSF